MICLAVTLGSLASLIRARRRLINKIALVYIVLLSFFIDATKLGLGVKELNILILLTLSWYLGSL